MTETNIRNLIKQIGGSAIVTSIVPSPDKLDEKFAIELGVSVMLDKPIIAIVQPGTAIPKKLAAVVDRFIEYYPNDYGGMELAIQDALSDMGFSAQDDQSETSGD